MADVILFMVNVRDGMTAADKEVAAMAAKMRQTGYFGLQQS